MTTVSSVSTHPQVSEEGVVHQASSFDWWQLFESYVQPYIPSVFSAGWNSVTYLRSGPIEFFRSQLEEEPDHYAGYKYVDLLLGFSVRRFMIITDPTLIRRALGTLKNDAGGRYLGGEEFRAVSSLIGKHNILTAERAEHDALKMFAKGHTFGSDSVRAQMPRLQAAAEAFAQGLDGTQTVVEFSRKFTFQAIMDLVFGPGIFGAEHSAVLTKIEEIVAKHALYRPHLPKLFDSDYQQGVTMLRDSIGNSEMDGGLIGEMRRGSFDEQQLFEMAFLMLFVGNGTTARGLTACLYFLAQNPEWQDRIRDDWEATGEQLDKLKDIRSLEAVIRESLRLAPPVWGQTRRAIRDFTLEDNEGREVAVSAGMDLILVHYLGHRDESRWKEPNEFRPERFLEPKSAAAHYEFGHGPNGCLGKYLAEALIRLLIVSILKTKTLSSSEQEMPSFHGDLFLNADQPLEIRIEQREAESH